MELDTVVCSDALDFLKSLPDQCAQACVTDPPFNLGFDYGPYSTDRRPLAEYGEWLWSICEEAERCLTSGSPVFVWQAMPHCREWAGWFPREWRIFAAVKGFVQIRPETMPHAWDAAGDARDARDARDAAWAAAEEEWQWHRLAELLGIEEVA